MVRCKPAANCVEMTGIPAGAKAEKAGAGMYQHPEPGGLGLPRPQPAAYGRPATPHGAGALSRERTLASNRKIRPAPLQDVAPAEPLASWFGGKKYLAKRIAERIEAIPHGCYAEPFCGMGGVFLRRNKRPKSEILNDLNGEIVNLFRMVREHPDELSRQFDWTLSSRAGFRRLATVPPGTLTDIQRAARFAYLQTLSFGGKPATEVTPGQTGAVSPHHRAKMTALRMRRLIAAAHERLQGVHIECLDWAAFIRRHDRPFTLFYIDPPYLGHEDDYGKGMFERADFACMAEMLRSLNGRFILSLNDTSEIRELFAGFEIEEVTTRYSANARSTRRARELLISGGGG